MKPWQIKLEQALAVLDAPAVLSRALLEQFGATVPRDDRGLHYIGASSWTYWIKGLVERGALQPVQRGLYLNCLRARPGTLADAVPWLQRDAIVSLNTVLGDAGVLNNPSRVVTAVVPIDPGAPPPSRLGRRQTKAGVAHFYGMPRAILEAGALEDRLEDNPNADHIRATPEKALVDWLYLGASPRSRRPLPPRGDIDLEMLDQKRLVRLARAAGVKDVLEKWREG
ncbi:MAG: hypothetical protein KY410_07510 [Proteobacteria bacterium]|nr:hypothetical protein [Pseudomonadota bacterium]